MRDQFLGRFGRALPVAGNQVTDFLKPSFVIAFLMLLGAVGAGFGLSTQAGQIVKELRK